MSSGSLAVKVVKMEYMKSLGFPDILTNRSFLNCRGSLVLFNKNTAEPDRKNYIKDFCIVKCL
jgi:hypothetical protein